METKKKLKRYIKEVIVMSKRAFETKQDLQDKFKAYIEKTKKEEKLANIAGFCVFCDINRDTYYAQKEIYPDTIKAIETELEDYTINAKINDTFKIFYMKNKFNYRDRQEIDNTNVNVEISNEDKEMLERIKQRLNEK